MSIFYDTKMLRMVYEKCKEVYVKYKENIKKYKEALHEPIANTAFCNNVFGLVRVLFDLFT